MTRTRITPPGRLEGGDVVRLASGWFVGLGARSNEAGFEQFRKIVQARGMEATALALDDLLHLKSGVSAVDEQTLVALPQFAAAFSRLGYQVVEVHPEDWHAANVVSWGGKILLPARHPRVQERLELLGFETFEVDLSEFKKQDGGASCLSLLVPVDKPL
jgi:dimethylargininase